jgi:hypothetical protein
VALIRAFVVAAIGGLLLTACVAHPVGPARTEATYERKAGTTARSALSEVQTARLMATMAASGRSYGVYTGQVLSDAEESLQGLNGTFGSIQPPGAAADDLRARLVEVLHDAGDHVVDLRVAARRGLLSSLEDLARPLDDDIQKLNALISELS